ncbi:MAG TPA: HD domain-containing protein [Bacteroidetes bacterium]|nr:HD domain-containing protein [Bacteroidota bacterium]
MNLRKEKEYVKRIAKLAKANKELKLRLSELQKKLDKLLYENEKQKVLLESLSPEQKRKGKEVEHKIRTLRFDMATVLFADIQGFSKLSGKTDSQAIIDKLDEIFFEFDAIAKKYKIEKIKTIGDTYMCAGGIPIKNSTNPIDVIMAAIEMKHHMGKVQHECDFKEDQVWDMKMGIHTGPVVANVTGKRKVSYEIKGDTVNTASRIESASDTGNIVISVMTYELVKEFFICEYFGKIPVKYKGDMDMYVVKGLKPEISENGDGFTPNKAFRIKFALIQFTDLQEVILDKLEKELPEYLYYHNVKHTVDVVTEVELIGWAEGISDEEMLLLKTAALFHDVGHVIQYDNHEYHGTVIAREMLPKYGYTPEQIDRICEIIMATKLPPKPQNLLESIICDADLDYLGRTDFIPVSNTLYKELHEQNKIGSLNEWNKLQVKFISGHQYFTKTARSLREVNKQKQIERLSKLITEDN